jgi:hypothetical protein
MDFHESNSRWGFGWVVFLALAGHLYSAENPQIQSLDPRGEMHIPIGIVNSLDSLKTFVKPERCFSPGVGSYGIYS